MPTPPAELTERMPAWYIPHGGGPCFFIGSGMSFHNMRAYGNPQFGPVSDAFDDWLTHAVQASPQERDRLLENWEQAPGARHCHPPRAEEHLLP